MKSSNQESCFCDCGCHKEGSQKLHVVPCCDKCKTCGQHIKFFCMNDHLKYCRPNAGKSGQNYVEEQSGITFTIQSETENNVIIDVRPGLLLRCIAAGVAIKKGKTVIFQLDDKTISITPEDAIIILEKNADELL